MTVSARDQPTGPPVRGECHLWETPITGWPDRDDPLDDEERRRAAAFTLPRARQVFVASRSVQRVIGAHYLAIPPRDVRIVRDCEHCGGPHGRPRFVDADLDYSVSHTRDRLVVAVVSAGRAGVDIEEGGSLGDVEQLVAHSCTPREREHLAALPPDCRTEELLRLWTRKEAGSKVTGHGLTAGFRRLDAIGPVLAADPAPEGWPREPIHLYDLPSEGGWLMALAATVPVSRIVRRRPEPPARPECLVSPSR
ncbi:4'-phosphopantetheinyl transferase family protein [Actinoplanes sp. CA-252034]|uniref:4'-phosphopantetheinyl transferase family protein n=1 Tax=Actinoplanes sp. CA-252034 TaxID=3239906 RepID=UPI003D988FBA